MTRSVLMVATLSFVFLGVAISLFGTVALDQHAYDAVVALATPGIIRVMKIINYGGDKLVMFPAMLLLYAGFPQSRRRWWIWLALMVAAPTIEGLTKIIVGRARPEGFGFAFPSGHVTAAAAAYFGAVFYLAGTNISTARRRLVRVAAVSAIVLVAIARVMLRAHWPSDTLAGAALGLALASVAALAATAQRRAEG